MRKKSGSKGNVLTIPDPPAPKEKFGWMQFGSRTNQVIVLACWLICTLGTLWFSDAHCSDVPYGDEYDIIPIIAEKQSFSLSWLWAPMNEHRIPLPRLIRFVLLRLTDNDFRAGVYAITFLLSGMGLATSMIAARLRGRYLITDAFFPLVWLHWGQVESLIWDFQVNFVLAIVLATVALIVIVTKGRTLSPGSALLVGACNLLLLLCGSYGLLTAVPLSIWLGCFAGVGLSRAGGTREKIGWSLVLFIIAAAFALTFLYLQDLPRGESPSSEVTPWDQIKVALAFFSIAFGPEFSDNWQGGSALMLLMLVGVVAMAFRTIRRNPAELSRASGIIVFLIPFFLMAAAIGHGRSKPGVEGGLEPRYATLWVPALCLVYYAAELYLRGPQARIAQIILLLVGLLMQLNVDYAMSYAGNFKLWRDAFCRDLDAGTPGFMLAEEYNRHPFGLWDGNPKGLDECFMMLREAHVGRFARMEPSPVYQRMILTNENSVRDLSTGLIRLTASRKVYAIKIVWKSESARVVKVLWRDSRRNQFNMNERCAEAKVSNNETAVSILRVYDTVDEFSFMVDRTPGQLLVGEITLFVGD